MLRVGVCGTDRHVMYPGIRSDRALPAGDDFIVIGHEAIGDQKNRRFAIKVDRALRELSPGIDFRTTDLESAGVRVYRASGITTLRVDPSGSPLEARLATLGRLMDLVKSV